MTAPHAAFARRNRTCLNGWWDFCPLPAAGPMPTEVPAAGWHPGSLLVPSWWTKPACAVRKAGERLFTDRSRERPGIFSPEHEFLFDAFRYPAEWAKSRNGFVRRTLALGPLPTGRRRLLRFEAITPRGMVFVNGHAFPEHLEAMLPLEIDATEQLRPGENELAVLVQDFPRDARGRTLYPSGNNIPGDNSGLWQDVFLIERSDLFVEDVTIRTSVRAGELYVCWQIANASARLRRIQLRAAVHPWRKDADPSSQPVALDLGGHEVSLAPGQTIAFEHALSWKDAKTWSPDAPNLYTLATCLDEAGTPVDLHCERFGFREIWIDGPDLLLNGYPVHLFSDWGHKHTPHYLTEAWTRQWYRMLRDAHMNHTRLHTHPHPPLLLEIADEEGILITGEAGLHGSGGRLAADEPAFWQNAAAHVRRFVRRDKNHPSLILWSVENEMRWNGDKTQRTYQELPRLRALFNQLDPTRPAYHEGDSSLWNEREQPIISRHYQKETAGIGWWDRSRPLTCGETALYHYNGPNMVLHLIGDEGFASYRACTEAAGLDMALIAETGRTLGVSAFGPWNLSCLDNLRMDRETIRLVYSDYTTPGMKPLFVPPQSSELAFWDPATPGYMPGFAWEHQKRGFRPLALIDRSQNTQAYAGSTFNRVLFLVNDLPRDVAGTLEVTLTLGEHAIASASYRLTAGRGRVASQVVSLDLPPEAEGQAGYTATFTADGQVLDTWTRRLAITPCAAITGPAVPVAVFGPGTLREALTDLGLQPTYVPSLTRAALASHSLLLLEKDTVRPGSRQNHQLRAFVRRGGRVIVLEQSISVFPGLALEVKPVHQAFFRAPEHPVLAGLEPEDLAYWGEDPYPQLDGESFVAGLMYRKDDGRHMLAILDAGEGGMGTGTLDYTPLFEATDGAGLILACQLRLTERLATIPAARRLLANLLFRAASYVPTKAAAPMVIDGRRTTGLPRLRRAAERGQSILVQNPTPEALRAWSALLGVPLTPTAEEPIWQAIRAAPDPLLAGISNEETCGIESWTYSPSKPENLPIATRALQPADGLEPLLTTAPESLLTELFIHMGKSEALRAHTASRFLFAEKSAPALLLARVRVGSGAILFSCYAPPADQRPRFARSQNRLRANLGQRFPGSLLDGPAVPAAPASSPGYPQKANLLAAALDQPTLERILVSTLPNSEHLPARPILRLIDGWQELASDTGTFAAPSAAPDLWLYFLIDAPAARKDTASDLGIPNPNALTFLDLTSNATGTAELILNGRTYPAIPLGPAPATFPDLPLERGINHVLIHWRPAAPGATLSPRLRDIAHRPETTLKFPLWG